jgi:hypothetical protein
MQVSVATDKMPATAAFRSGQRVFPGSLATHHPGASAASIINASDDKIAAAFVPK